MHPNIWMLRWLPVLRLEREVAKGRSDSSLGIYSGSLILPNCIEKLFLTSLLQIVFSIGLFDFILVFSLYHHFGKSLFHFMTTRSQPSAREMRFMSPGFLISRICAKFYHSELFNYVFD